MANMSAIAQFGRLLSVQIRLSEFGMSVISDNTAKFFSIDYVYLYPEECKKYIKKCASPELQTKLM